MRKLLFNLFFRRTACIMLNAAVSKGIAMGFKEGYRMGLHNQTGYVGSIKFEVKKEIEDILNRAGF